MKILTTTEDAFAVGKLEGHKEALDELTELIEEGVNLETLKIFIRAKKKALVIVNINNPFKTKDD